MFGSKAVAQVHHPPLPPSPPPHSHYPPSAFGCLHQHTDSRDANGIANDTAIAHTPLLLLALALWRHTPTPPSLPQATCSAAARQAIHCPPSRQSRPPARGDTAPAVLCTWQPRPRAVPPLPPPPRPQQQDHTPTGTKPTSQDVTPPPHHHHHHHHPGPRMEVGGAQSHPSAMLSPALPPTAAAPASSPTPPSLPAGPLLRDPAASAPNPPDGVTDRAPWLTGPPPAGRLPLPWRADSGRKAACAMATSSPSPPALRPLPPSRPGPLSMEAVDWLLSTRTDSALKGAAAAGTGLPLPCAGPCATPCTCT
jgi:hypothetical protein